MYDRQKHSKYVETFKIQKKPEFKEKYFWRKGVNICWSTNRHTFKVWLIVVFLKVGSTYNFWGSLGFSKRLDC